MLAIFSLVYAFFILVEVIPAHREKRKKEFWTYLVLLASGYLINVFLAFDIKVPSPAEPIKRLITITFGL